MVVELVIVRCLPLSPRELCDRWGVSHPLVGVLVLQFGLSAQHTPTAFN